MMNIYSEKEKKIIAETEKMQSISEKYGILHCLKYDNDFPADLKIISDAPVVLYYKGSIDIINMRKSIAVVGSRNCSEEGRRISYETGYFLAKNNINVVNGLAIGCDTEALRGALAANGKCVAVMPCGLEQVQPKSNIRLAQEILEKGGCLISEYPVGTTIQKYNYVRRDRLQSGISQGVLVVEAEVDSGTMHTAEFAAKQYKRLACYYHKLLEKSSGNEFLTNRKKAEVIKDEKDLMNFVKHISEEEKYEQLSLIF